MGLEWSLPEIHPHSFRLGRKSRPRCPIDCPAFSVSETAVTVRWRPWFDFCLRSHYQTNHRLFSKNSGQSGGGGVASRSLCLLWGTMSENCTGVFSVWSTNFDRLWSAPNFDWLWYAPFSDIVRIVGNSGHRGVTGIRLIRSGPERGPVNQGFGTCCPNSGRGGVGSRRRQLTLRGDSSRREFCQLDYYISTDGQVASLEE